MAAASAGDDSLLFNEWHRALLLQRGQAGVVRWYVL